MLKTNVQAVSAVRPQVSQVSVVNPTQVSVVNPMLQLMLQMTVNPVLAEYAVRPLVSSYNLLLAQPEGTRLGVSQGSLMLKMTVLLAESAPRRKVCYNQS